jgi:hypothetical protein
MRGVACLVGIVFLTTLHGTSPDLPIGKAVARSAEAWSRTNGSEIPAHHLAARGSAVVAVSGARRTGRDQATPAGDPIAPCVVRGVNDTLSGTNERCRHPSLTEQQLKEVTWARDRFHAAGLIPPSVRFVFHDDTRRCRLRRGLFNPNTRSIEICTMNRETLIHELAHAWIDANLSEEARATFTRHRGLTMWNDHSVPWEHRATEHAAEIIAWGVEEESRLVSWIESHGHHTFRLLTIPDSTPEELAVSYQQLTGIPAHPDRSRPPATLRSDFSPEAGRLGPPTD